LSIIIK